MNCSVIHGTWIPSVSIAGAASRSKGTGHNSQTLLHLLSSVQGKRIRGSRQSHAALSAAQTPSMHSLPRYDDYPAAWQRPPAPLQAPRHLTDCCNDVRPATFPYFLHAACPPVLFHYRCVNRCPSEWEWACWNRPGIDLLNALHASEWAVSSLT